MDFFFTLEISDPAYEIEGIRNVTVKSPSLKGRGDISFFIPTGIENLTDVPLVILLHGVYGSHWVWSKCAGVHRITQIMIDKGKIEPMVIAMPSDGLPGDGSAYINYPNGIEFENWIIQDVPEVAKKIKIGVSEKSLLFISGLSMGGMGALRLGAKHYHKFAAFSGHSSMTELEHMKLFQEQEERKFQNVPDMEHRVLNYMIQNKNNLPPFRFDCGVQDKLIEANRNLHEELKKNKIDHNYFEYDGEHNWDYWKENICHTLRFFSERIKILNHHHNVGELNVSG